MKCKYLMRKLLSGVLACLLILVTVAPLVTIPTYAEGNQTVRIGYFDFAGMFEGAGPNEEKGGYCYEYMMQVAIYTGWHYEFCYGSYAELYEKLKNGEIDVLPYTNYNAQRGQEVLFSTDKIVEEEYYLAVNPADKAHRISTEKDLNGTKISTLEGADYNDLLISYVQNNNLNVEIKYYSSLNETWDALRKGEVNATVFTSNAYSTDPWDCICTFGSKPTYIAVSKERPDLLSKLNEAVSFMNADNPAFLGDLYSKYFSDNPVRKKLLPEEQAWIENHPVLHVGGFTNDAPYLFSVNAETGEATGLTVDLINGIIQRLNINASADFKEYNTLAEMEEALDSGELDVIIPFYPNFQIGQEHNLIISNTVRVSNMELVYKKGTSFKDAFSKIATPSTRLGIYYVQENYHDSEIVPANSVQNAVDLVLNGTATGAIAQNVVIHSIKERHSELKSMVLPEGCGTCFATRPSNYPLIKILNRGMNYFTNAEIAAIASTYTYDPVVTTRAYLASHIDVLIMLIIIIIIVIVLIFTLIKVNHLFVQEKVLYADLEEAKQKAEVANESKTAFLFNMSHDIRTPMNAILGYTNIGLRHIDDIGKAKDSLMKIKIAGNHLLNLINDILEMSRIESGHMELSEDPIDIRRSIEAVNQMCQSIAVPKSIDFTMEFGDIRNPYIYADELHANEVLINLISNAVKYTGAGGKVRYTINQISDVVDGMVMYRFEITDNGIGMSEEFQKHLFESFTREKTSTVSKQEGAGLGLSIVKKIVDLAGGTIIVRSKQGVGSTFILEIPFRVMDDAVIEVFKNDMAKVDEMLEDEALSGKCTLLVEDNEMNREIATELLEDAGLIVETAEDGQIAVNKIKEKGAFYYDFVLMDIQMPAMNGYEATAAIRKLPEGDKIPIIALSANAFKEDIDKSIAAGMNAHIAKPVDIKALFEAIHELTSFESKE